MTTTLTNEERSEAYRESVRAEIAARLGNQMAAAGHYFEVVADDEVAEPEDWNIIGCFPCHVLDEELERLLAHVSECSYCARQLVYVANVDEDEHEVANNRFEEIQKFWRRAFERMKKSS